MSNLKPAIWELVEPVVSANGFELFDLDVPAGRNGALRVYIWKGKGGNVLLDDCASVSKRLEELVQLDELIPESYILEVSSPGVNRKLSRPEHFVGAVGERIKVVTIESEGPSRSLKGTLLRCQDGMLELQDEESESLVQLSIAKVKRAHVDFQFGRS
jgi:ribosome maturation factor RimP